MPTFVLLILLAAATAVYALRGALRAAGLTHARPARSRPVASTPQRICRQRRCRRRAAACLGTLMWQTLQRFARLYADTHLGRTHNDAISSLDQ